MEAREAKLYAQGFYAGIKIVAGYMQAKSPLFDGLLERSSTGYRDASLKGLFYRARAWMHTLEKLNQTRDIQAIYAANRALLEITVDMLLIHYDKSNESGWRMYWWAESEKMRLAELLIKYYQELNQPIPEEYMPISEAYESDKSNVDSMRKSLWPDKKYPDRPRHPDRWTGRANLYEDINYVDENLGSLILSELNFTLKSYYRSEYRRMNWYIHSGVASFWNISPNTMDLMCGLAFKHCADLAFLCTKIVLLDFDFDKSITNLKDEWDDVFIQRGLACIENEQVESSDGA